MLQKRHNIENVLVKSKSPWAVLGLLLCLAAFLGGMAYSMGELIRVTVTLGERLIGLGWGRVYHLDSPLLVFTFCLGDGRCGPGANQALSAAFPFTPFALSFLPLIGAALIFRKGSSNQHVKMPGQQRWALDTDDKIKLYTKGDRDRPENRQSGYLGYFMNPVSPGRFDLKKLQMLLPPVEDRCTNTIIISGVGGGKTSGLFIPQLMMDAVQGGSVILFDLKYPNRRGFYNMIAFWHRLGRQVQLFTPFSEDTLHMPLLDSVTDMKTALEMAESIITPPEYQKEVGAHYKNVERHTLASILLAVANHPVPSKRTFREVLRVAQSTKTELEQWYQRESVNNPEIKEAMKGLFDRSPAANADMLRGLVSELKIFFNPVLERATTSSPGRNLNLADVFRRPTLLYIGIEQEQLVDGSGETLIKLIKRLIDRVALQESARQGGTLATHAEYYFDEFNSFGQMGNMMRSTATNRERNIGMTIGVQNSSQGRLVYGDLYYAAMTENVIGHTILLPYGITGQDAINWSKLLGDTTKVVTGESAANDQFLPTPFKGRRTVSERVERQPFLPSEEFATYTKNEGILMMMGCPPVRIKLPRYDAPFVVPTPWWKFWARPVENRIAKVYRNVMGTAAPGVLTDQLLADPGFRQRSRAPTAEEMPETPEALLHAWADAALEQGAKVRLVRATTPPKVYVTTESFDSPLSDDQLNFLVDQSKWLARGAAGTELRITDTGQALLGEAKLQRLTDAEVLGPIVRWMHQRAASIEHHPVREALPEDQRQEVTAFYEYETLALPSTVLRELLGVVPDLPTKRLGTRNLVVVPLNDPARLRTAVEVARSASVTHPNGEAKGWGKVRQEAAAQRLVPDPERPRKQAKEGGAKATKTSKAPLSLLEEHALMKTREAAEVAEAAELDAIPAPAPQPARKARTEVAGEHAQEAAQIAEVTALEEVPVPTPNPARKSRKKTPADTAPPSLFLPLPELERNPAELSSKGASEAESRPDSTSDRAAVPDVTAVFTANRMRSDE
ncbi:hypothetical protein Dalu01_03182 [Deinococcus aluminii]|uniref:Uncharacterized protein n=2 Tax=Deinococcus aluminii TaxID=1656885 RepID=A0ABP9XHC4_9DEIO